MYLLIGQEIIISANLVFYLYNTNNF